MSFQLVPSSPSSHHLGEVSPFMGSASAGSAVLDLSSLPSAALTVIQEMQRNLVDVQNQTEAMRQRTVVAINQTAQTASADEEKLREQFHELQQALLDLETQKKQAQRKREQELEALEIQLQAEVAAAQQELDQEIDGHALTRSQADKLAQDAPTDLINAVEAVRRASTVEVAALNAQLAGLKVTHAANRNSWADQIAAAQAKSQKMLLEVQEQQARTARFEIEYPKKYRDRAEEMRPKVNEEYHKIVEELNALILNDISPGLLQKISAARGWGGSGI